MVALTRNKRAPLPYTADSRAFCLPLQLYTHPSIRYPQTRTYACRRRTAQAENRSACLISSRLADTPPSPPPFYPTTMPGCRDAFFLSACKKTLWCTRAQLARGKAIVNETNARSKAEVEVRGFVLVDSFVMVVQRPRVGLDQGGVLKRIASFEVVSITRSPFFICATLLICAQPLFV